MSSRLQEALTHHERGELSRAEEAYREIIARTPSNLEAHALLADIRHQQGRHAEAAGLLRKALGLTSASIASDAAIDAALEERAGGWKQVTSCYHALALNPDDASTLNARGNALLALQRPADALQSFDEALALEPDFAAVLYNRGIVLLRLRRPEDALTSFDRLLALEPNDAEALTQRGNALLDLKRPADSAASYDGALALAPDSVPALCNRGVALAELERFADALSSYDRALALEPANAHCLAHRGHALVALQRYGDALASYDRALALAPGNVELLVHRGNAQLDLKQPAEALASFDRALSLAPDYPIALNNRGNALLDLQRPADALASYDRVVALQPSLAEAFSNRGNALRDLKRHEEALASYERAIALKPDFPEALGNCGNVLMYLRRFEAAAEVFARLTTIAPGYDYAVGGLAYCLLNCCAWENLSHHVRCAAEVVERGQRSVMPFAFLAMSQSPRAQLECARTYATDRFPVCGEPLWTGVRRRQGRIRVAYLSADFHEHATAYLMAEFFELHDRRRFETTAISYGPADGSGMRERLQHAFERFVDVRANNDRQVAELLHDLEIDIAVDLKGYTRDGRLGILSHRPAPLQVSYLGYPGTLGAEYVDYIIADARVIPPEHDAYYSEKVVRLPESYQVNDSGRHIAERTPSRAEANLPPTGFVFSCFNNSYKIVPEMFEIWMRLLKAVGGSVLWLLDGGAIASGNLRREAERRGVAPSRLIFAPRARLDLHLARHRLADLFLDTLPVNAHTTASDALWAGLPVLTCVGDTFAARVGGSLVCAAGLPELAVPSLEEYESLALELAATPPLLAGLRARLARNLASCPLFDTDRFRQHMEACYLTMWDLHTRGDKPRSFSVESV